MAETVQHTRLEKLLLEAARTFNSTLEYEELNEMVLRLVAAAVGAESSLISRLDKTRADIKVRFMSCEDCKMQSFQRELGTGVTGWVTEHREPVIINDSRSDPRIDGLLEKQTGRTIRSLIALPLVGKGQIIGVVGAINKREGAFDQQDLDTLTGLNNQIAVAIDNAHLYRVVKREALEKNLLYETGKKLAGMLSLQEVLKAVMDSLKQLVGYTVGGVYLCDENGVNINEIYKIGYDSSFDTSIRLKCGDGLVGAAATSGKPVIVDDVTVDKRYIMTNPDTRSEIVVPISIDDRVIGVINLESNQTSCFSEADLSLITTFALQAAISLERVRLHESNLQARQLEEQLNVAREIQRSFLPPKDPVIPGYDITGRNSPSGQVGGDYYDFIRIVDSQLGVAIADVSGKGIPAALIMASFRASLIAEIRNNYSIRTIGEKVNSLMFESLEAGNYVSGVYGVLDTRHHIFTFSNYGHNPPILLRKNGELELLTEGGLVLGVSPSSLFEERALMLAPGEVMILYTDGVSEVFDEQGREFGTDGLVDIVKAHRDETAAEIADAVQEAVKDFAAADHVFDDITMIVLKRRFE